MAEEDYSVLVAAFVALVAIVGLVVQLGPGSSGMLSASYGSYQTENPSLQRGSCPTGYAPTNIVCTGSVGRTDGPRDLCYTTAELYCVADANYYSGSDVQPRSYGADKSFIAHEENCVLTPAAEGQESYYLCS